MKLIPLLLLFGLIGYFLGRFFKDKIVIFIIPISLVFVALGFFMQGIRYMDSPGHQFTFSDYIEGLAPGFIVVVSLIVGKLMGDYFKDNIRRRT